MPLHLTASGIDADGIPIANRRVSVDRRPNVCPMCHVTIEPAPGGLNPYTNLQWLEVHFRCSNLQCSHFIIAVYKMDSGQTTWDSNTPLHFHLTAVLPWRPVVRDFSQTIKDTSPSFPGIYNQANAAEDYGLPEVAGPGYRKALEFLLKDYAIKLNPNPNDAATIRQMQLANVISTYFNDPRMSAVFSRAAWLGNDQTHYERRWIDLDISHLKTLINASVHFIEMEVLASSLPVEMPHPNQAK
jgi:hypothetical protein